MTLKSRLLLLVLSGWVLGGGVCDAAWVEVANVKCNGLTGCTTSGVNTQGGTGPADTYVIGIHGQVGSMPTGTDISDSGGNSYTCKNLQDGSATSDRMCYAWNVSTSASFTWTVSKSGCACSVTILALKGGRTSSDPFDAQSAGASNASSATIQPGSLTTASGNIYVTSTEAGAFVGGCGGGGLTINSSFSTPVFQDFASGTAYGGAISWKESTGSAENPTWTCGNAGENQANMLALVAAGGGTGGSSSPCILGGGIIRPGCPGEEVETKPR